MREPTRTANISRDIFNTGSELWLLRPLPGEQIRPQGRRGLRRGRNLQPSPLRGKIRRQGRRGLSGEYPNPVGGTKDTQLARTVKVPSKLTEQARSRKELEEPTD